MSENLMKLNLMLPKNWIFWWHMAPKVSWGNTHVSYSVNFYKKAFSEQWLMLPQALPKFITLLASSRVDSTRDI